MAPKTLLPVAAIVATALAQSSGGCGAQPTLTSGIHNIGDRQYTLKIPENYDSANPVPPRIRLPLAQRLHGRCRQRQQRPRLVRS